MKLVLASLLLLAGPLAAQQTVVVPDVVVENDHPITNEITIEVMSDSVRLARIADAVESLAAAIAECGCTENTGTSNVVRIGQGALVIAAFFIGFQLKGIKDNIADKNSYPEPSPDDHGEGE